MQRAEEAGEVTAKEEEMSAAWSASMAGMLGQGGEGRSKRKGWRMEGTGLAAG